MIRNNYDDLVRIFFASPGALPRHLVGTHSKNKTETGAYFVCLARRNPADFSGDQKKNKNVFENLTLVHVLSASPGALP